MPGRNGTGPIGMGPMTGRGAGFCAGYGEPGCASQWGVRGAGFGCGQRMGRGRMFCRSDRPGYGNGAGFAPRYEGDPDLEKTALTNQVAYLEKRIEDMHSRIRELNED